MNLLGVGMLHNSDFDSYLTMPSATTVRETICLADAGILAPAIPAFG